MAKKPETTLSNAAPVGEGSRQPVEDFSSYLDAVPESAWKLAALAAQIAASYPYGPEPIGSAPRWRKPNLNGAFGDDAVYQAALKRAQLLIDFASQRRGIMHADELFEPGKAYSLRGITEVFRRAGWRNLTSPGSVRKLIDEIQSEADNLVRSRTEARADDGICGSFTRLNDLRAFQEPGPPEEFQTLITRNPDGSFSLKFERIARLCRELHICDDKLLIDRSQLLRK